MYIISMTQILKTEVKIVCAWCDEENIPTVMFNWNEIRKDGRPATDCVCGKCVGMLFSEDPEAVDNVTLKRVVIK